MSDHNRARRTELVFSLAVIFMVVAAIIAAVIAFAGHEHPASSTEKVRNP